MSTLLNVYANLVCFAMLMLFAVKKYPKWKMLSTIDAIFRGDDNVLLILVCAFTFLGNALWQIFV